MAELPEWAIVTGEQRARSAVNATLKNCPLNRSGPAYAQVACGVTRDGETVDCSMAGVSSECMWSLVDHMGLWRPG